MVNFFISLHSLDAMRTILCSFCFVCNETSAEWERVLHLPRLNAKLKLQTTFTNILHVAPSISIDDFTVVYAK